jgi:hypothetical protein
LTVFGTKNAYITSLLFDTFLKGDNEMKSLRSLLSFIVILLSILVAAPVSAGTIWIDWTKDSATIGNPGSALGTLNGVAVTYKGEILDFAPVGTVKNYWAPDSSFIGGTVTTSPSTVGGFIALQGTYTGINKITFDSPIVNPVLAIWSLGSSSIPASFVFS